MKPKEKWLAAYPNYMDWFISLESEASYSMREEETVDEFDSFSDAKRSLIRQIQDRIDNDRHAIKYLRTLKKPKGNI